MQILYLHVLFITTELVILVFVLSIFEQRNKTAFNVYVEGNGFVLLHTQAKNFNYINWEWSGW